MGRSKIIYHSGGWVARGAEDGPRVIIARSAIEITPDLSSLSHRTVYWIIEVIGG